MMRCKNCYHDDLILLNYCILPSTRHIMFNVDTISSLNNNDEQMKCISLYVFQTID